MLGLRTPGATHVRRGRRPNGNDTGEGKGHGRAVAEPSVRRGSDPRPRGTEHVGRHVPDDRDVDGGKPRSVGRSVDRSIDRSLGRWGVCRTAVAPVGTGTGRRVWCRTRGGSRMRGDVRRSWRRPPSWTSAAGAVKRTRPAPTPLKWARADLNRPYVTGAWATRGERRSRVQVRGPVYRCASAVVNRRRRSETVGPARREPASSRAVRTKAAASRARPRPYVPYRPMPPSGAPRRSAANRNSLRASSTFFVSVRDSVACWPCAPGRDAATATTPPAAQEA